MACSNNQLIKCNKFDFSDLRRSRLGHFYDFSRSRNRWLVSNANCWLRNDDWKYSCESDSSKFYVLGIFSTRFNYNNTDNNIYCWSIIIIEYNKIDCYIILTIGFMYYLINLANYPFSLLLLSMLTQLKVLQIRFWCFFRTIV